MPALFHRKNVVILCIKTKFKVKLTEKVRSRNYQLMFLNRILSAHTH